PALTPGHPFLNVSEEVYWSSTSYFGGQGGSPNAWAIRLADARYMNDSVSNNKTNTYNWVWAVKSNEAGMQSTGQYVSYVAGDDASTQKGIPPAFPRYIDRGDGTIADTVTGLIWLKQADCIHDTWDGSLNALSALSDGQCGLTDGSAAGDWRMPSRS